MTMPRFVRRLVPVLGLVALIGGCQDQAPPAPPQVRPVKTMVVGEIDPFARRWFPGRAKATQEVDLSFRVAGTLVAFPAQVGAEIAAGDLLARVDPADFQVEVDRADAAVDRARAALENAELALARTRELRARGHVAQARLDADQATADQARADVASAAAALEKARLQLGYTALTAPFAGTVVATYVQNFEDISAKQPVARLLDTSRIEMVVDIPETMISAAPTAYDIKVEFDAFPELEIPATIKEIGTEANQTTRTYPVTLIMDQPADVKILPGMAGRATGRADAAPGIDGPVIPVSAVFAGTADGVNEVWVVSERPHRVARRQVELGLLTDQGITVLRGLEDGEVIVTAGVGHLRDGQSVRLLGR